MKAFLDTSVLVPVFYGDHVHHAASLDLFTKFPQRMFAAGRIVSWKYIPR
jgi:predicted nucleic acid-binding protein